MLNLDFNKRIVISTDKVEWQPSGLPNIDLKPLALEDHEIGHLTALVRYRNGSAFTRKERSNGEEMLILSGNFRSQYADYATGTYYRSPPNHEQLPLSQQGCVMFLKLNQFSSDDTEEVAVNTQKTEWLELTDGIKFQLLHQSEATQTLIYQWDKGTKIEAPSLLKGGAEIFILKGNIKDRQGDYPAGTWLRSPSFLFDEAIASVDSAAFIKYGHLNLVKA